jgi:hypothetical protein
VTVDRFRELIAAGGIVQLMEPADRHLVIAVAGGPIVSVRCRGGEVEAEELPSVAGLGSDTLVVELAPTDAWAVGAGRALIEDVFAEGSLRLRNQRPDDFRHGGAVVELVLEGLVHAGLVERAVVQTSKG